MSPPGCQKMLAKPGNQNAEERCPVHSLKSQAQKAPNPLLIQDKNILQPSLWPWRVGIARAVPPPSSDRVAAARDGEPPFPPPARRVYGRWPGAQRPRAP